MNLSEDRDYCLISDESGIDEFLVKIMRGDFIGTVVAFDEIKIVEGLRATETEEAVPPVIDFKYSIVKELENIAEEDIIRLEGFLSHVLHDIIIRSDSESIIYTDDNGNRLTDYDPPKSITE